MWLTVGDFVRIVERAVLADASARLPLAIMINFMSVNQDIACSLDEAHRYLD